MIEEQGGIANSIREARMGQIAYELYRTHCGGVSIHNEPLSDWHKLSPGIKDNWIAVAVGLKREEDKAPMWFKIPAAIVLGAIGVTIFVAVLVLCWKIVAALVGLL